MKVLRVSFFSESRLIFMVQKFAFLFLWLAALCPSVVLAQRSQIEGQKFQERQDPLRDQQGLGRTIPSVNQPSFDTNSVVVHSQQAITYQQRQEFQRRQKAREELARIRQREMEKQGQSETLYPRLVGEFEPQQAVLFSICDWQSHHFPILKEIIEKTAGHAELVILYNDAQRLAKTIQSFASDENHTHVEFLKLDLNTVWLRDFGPRFAEKENGHAMAIDFYYEGSRPKDDDFPEKWSDLTGTEFNHVPWTLQGGNLLSNGKGISVASRRIFKDNRVQFPAARGRDPIDEERKFVVRQFKLFCNIKELVLLEPLENESTQHVDMFCTFLAPDLVLVAQLDRRYDPRNAQILDANARTLAQLKVDGKPMRVERILVPPRQDKYWSPYTNIVLTDRLVLMPTFQSDPPSYVERAVNTYRRLLPSHHVTTIDMSSMSKLEGSLHCLSCNVPEFATMPQNRVSFQIAWKGKVGATAGQPPRTGDGIARSSSSRQKVDSESLDDAQPGRIAQSEYQEKVRRAREAIKTYRRTFRFNNGELEIDGYVIGVGDRSATLFLADAQQEQIVRLNFFEDNDREWLIGNREQINENGKQVKDFLLNFDK